MQLAADALALEERLRPAVLAVAEDRRAEFRHVHTQLMGTPGHRKQRHPGDLVAEPLDRGVAGHRALALLRVERHLLAGTARQLGDRSAERRVGTACGSTG